jgi:UDPglucose--hexose-1-phosphate uridylyltransferase
MKLESPHRRFNPLTGEWLLVSPHRARRPWLGQVERVPPENLPTYDPDCYLCPGNARAGGKRNPDYTSTFVFDNDFPALFQPGQLEATEPEANLDDSPPRAGAEADKTRATRGGFPGTETPSGELFLAQPEYGLCRVVCFSPQHDLTLPELSQEQVAAVIDTWRKQTQELGSLEFSAYVQIFENKGALMGCSNPHPHSQIWAVSHIPNEPAKELSAQNHYLKEHGSCLLCDYLQAELRSGERIVVENAAFAALVPFWAVWPFELIVISKRHVAWLTELDQSESVSLADVIRNVTARYDRLFEVSFPYSMGFHQAPVDGGTYDGWHLHLHYYPPLLRSATVRKFMVGFEMLAMPQRDLTPETAAERLRTLW